MRIYVASSWRIEEKQQETVSALRAVGHEVYDFRHPAPGNDGFSWRQIDPDRSWLADPARFRAGLEHPVAQRGFAFDMTALRECDACVLVLPCGQERPPGNGVGRWRWQAQHRAPRHADVRARTDVFGVHVDLRVAHRCDRRSPARGQAGMSGAVVLAVGGTVAALLSAVGGLITPRRPRLGPRLVGAAGLVMLAANVIVVVTWGAP